MTAEEIRSKWGNADDPAIQVGSEIAAQLAEANEAQRARSEKLDQQIAEAKERADSKGEFFDALVAELKPLLPKIKEFCESAFALPSSLSEPVAFVAPPAQLDGDAAMLDYLKSRGHDEEKAKQILGNHRNAVRAEMFQSGWGAPPVASPEEVPDGKEKEADPAA